MFFDNNFNLVVPKVTSNNLANEMKNDPRRCQCNLCNCVMKPEKKSGLQLGFKPVTSAIPVRCSNQLSYEATDVGSRSIMGSYVPVKEQSVNDVYEINHI